MSKVIDEIRRQVRSLPEKGLTSPRVDEENAMCPACATIALTIAGVSYAVNRLRKQSAASAERDDAETSANATNAAA
jgi:hypothetical protein